MEPEPPAQPPVDQTNHVPIVELSFCIRSLWLYSIGLASLGLLIIWLTTRNTFPQLSSLSLVAAILIGLTALGAIALPTLRGYANRMGWLTGAVYVDASSASPTNANGSDAGWGSGGGCDSSWGDGGGCDS